MVTSPKCNNLLKEEDIVSRSIIKPTHIDQYGKLSLNTFAFPDDRPESVSCNRILDNDTQKIHNVGLQLQKTQRQRKREQGKEPNNTYQGYIEAPVGNITSITVGTTSFTVEHCPENGNNAHCHINIHVGKKSEKALARVKLFEVFSGLVPYHD